MSAAVDDARLKLAYLVTHPIQYQAPLLRQLAQDEEFDLHVIFQSDFSTKAYFDKGFSRNVEWDVPLLEGYSYTVLPKLRGTPNRVTTQLPVNTGLWKLLREIEPDVLWVHGYGRPYNVLAIMLGIALGSKVLIRDDAHKLGNRRTLLREMIKKVQFHLFSKLDVSYLSIGKLNKDYLSELGAPSKNIFSAPYAVDNDFFRRKIADAHANREHLRSGLDIDGLSPIILYAGKMHDRKRPMDLLAAYSHMREGWEESASLPYLLFAGDGELLARLRTETEAGGFDRVRFLGFQTQHQLAALYDLCDIFVMPSAAEPWGLVVNEVMNAGKPVIVTYECGCWPDLVKEGLNGYVINVGDTQTLACLLTKLVLNPQLAMDMGEESLRIIDKWDFAADVAGIKHACFTLTKRRLNSRDTTGLVAP